MGNIFRKDEPVIHKRKQVTIDEIIDKALGELCVDISDIVKSYLRKIQYVTTSPKDFTAFKYYSGCKLCSHTHYYSYEYKKVSKIHIALEQTKKLFLKSDELKRLYPYIHYLEYDNLLHSKDIFHCKQCEMLLFTIESYDSSYNEIINLYVTKSFKFDNEPVTNGTLLFPLDSVEKLLNDINSGHLSYTLGQVRTNIWAKPKELNFLKLKEENLCTVMI